MNLFEALLDAQSLSNEPVRVYGVVVGVVTNNRDPDSLGRVKVKFPWLREPQGGVAESDWARVASPMAGNGRGLCLVPEVDDEVLVAFEHGDVRFPYILGSLWNGKDAPPATNGDGKNNLRVIKSRSGHTIKLSDEAGKESIEIADATGKNCIVIDTAKNTLTITADKDIVLCAAQGTIKLDAQRIEMTSTADSKIEAGAGMDVKASAAMNIKGATVNIN